MIDIEIPLVLMWGLYCLVSIGYGSEEYLRTCNSECRLFGINTDKQKLSTIMFVGGLSIVGWFYCSYYYTGSTPVELLKLLLGGQSSYKSYQEYFSNTLIGSSVFMRLPYILLMGINRGVLYYSFIALTVSGRIRSHKSKLFLFLLLMGHLYFGVSRGTNFEAYQAFTLVFYCYILYNEKNNKKINYVLLLCLGLVMVMAFLIMLVNRGHTIVLTSEIKQNLVIDQKSLIVQLMPLLVIVAEWVFAYIGYGLYFLSVMITEVTFSSVKGTIDFFIPFEYSPIEETSLLADKGVCWTPDLADFIDKTGLIILLFIVFLAGRLLKCIGNKCRYDDSFYVLLYLVFVQMISFPIGNFLQYSSEKLVLMFTVASVLFRSKYRIKPLGGVRG
ncbi:hypothetical protein [Pseudobutyrivibrio xylanivorans]|nr:hypothetical protein [Pseudobutyrivibrio xylanivorans]